MSPESVAGLNGARSGLFFRAIEIIEAIKPASVLFENVPGLLSSNHGDDFLCVLSSFQDAGYVIDTDILDCAGVLTLGLAQRRRRVFIACQHINHLLNEKSSSSRLTIAQCLCESFALALDVAGTPLNISSNDWDFDATRPLDSLQKRIKLFSLDREEQASILAENLAEIPTSSGFAPGGYSESRDGKREYKPCSWIQNMRNKKTWRCCSPRSRAPRSHGSRYWMLTLADIERVHQGINLKSETTESTIYSFARANLSIARLIARSETSCPSFWSAESSCSTALKGYIGYARRASSSLFTEMGWIQPWANFLAEALQAEEACLPKR